MKLNIFALLSTCMEVSVSSLCLFVHEPPYQTVVVYCNSIFCHDSSCMDHCTIFYVRVGLTQTCSNYQELHYVPYERPARIAIALYPIGRPVRATIRLYSIGRPVRGSYY